MVSPAEDDKITPRRNSLLVGHDDAERVFFDACRSGRMHHAWLLTGPPGIGKATLAFRMARFVLALGEGGRSAVEVGRRDLYIDPSLPVFRRVAAGGHADLLTIERGVGPRGNLRSEIVVDDVRRVADFLHLTAGEGGWRVVIVDSADEMNRHAANSLLKILEEPPPSSLLLMVSHNPGRLLPTIRSRCRTLSLRSLGEDDLCRVIAAHEPDRPTGEIAEIARLAEGSAGFALDLARHDGLRLMSDLEALTGSLPRVDLPALYGLSERLAPASAEARYRIFRELLMRWLAAIAHTAAAAPPPGDPNGRIAACAPLDRWLEVWEKVGRLFERADAVNLDRKQVLVGAFTALQQATRRT